MTEKRGLIRGALTLTAAGFITRFMGFFFRIFLSHSFGEENVGLYQLIFPVYTLCLALSTAGIQTALTRTTARKLSLGDEKDALRSLYTALFLTLTLSFLSILILQQYADFIAVRFLGDARCAPLLVIISYALPCAAVHSCICGYCFGMQKTRVPALSQLLEQTVRIASVTALFYLMQSRGEIPSVSLAVTGITAGEFASALYSARVLSRMRRGIYGRGSSVAVSFHAFLENARELIALSLPLTANRTAVTLLQSVEAASIPACLKLYSHSSSQALSIYGVLTGMALPLVLFPSALTNSIGVMLMPAVAEKQAAEDRTGILRLLRRTAGSCFILGMSCCLVFLLFGPLIGKLLFHSSTAGRFIVTLAWICPFLYTNTALMSTINGLGKTTHTLLINTVSLLIRIFSVFAGIPHFGIQAYLWGLLASQFAVTALAAAVLIRGQ